MEIIEELLNILYGEKTEQNFQLVNQLDKLIQNYLTNFPFKKDSYPAFEALSYLCDNYKFNTVLDIGSGEGYQSQEFVNRGKVVTAIDYGISGRTSEKKENYHQIIGDFNEYIFEEKYDCVWAAHVLEHQLNPNLFLKKLLGCVRDGGVIAITVPPYKSEVVSGHVTLWNAGILLYHLILAGCDCSNARIKKSGYNISVICEYKSINVLGEISYDKGDIDIIKKYLPEGIIYTKDIKNNSSVFDGNIYELNW